MSEQPTDAMQQFGGPPSATMTSGPGLVLLYTETFSQMPSAWALQPQGPTRIGSGDQAELRLPVKAVSRLHAEVFRNGGGYHIRDLQSTNGTYVDGCRITETHLVDLAEIRIGDAIFKFVETDIAEYQRFRIDGSLTAGARRSCHSKNNCIGGFQLDRIAAHLERVARSPLNMLLLGESGTGKEVLAQALHANSGCRGEFVGVNCAALTANLLESELFGYKRGAFSGADRDKPGLIRAAHHGTLLLDEIGDMPSEAQVRLLRVLQNREVLPVGATTPEPVSVRVLGATHRDLRDLQTTGAFRADLYARLNEDTITLPPLRERKEDLLMLLQFFFRRHGGPTLTVSFPFMMALLHYDWPYNVRELESCAKRCVFLAQGDRLDKSQLPHDVMVAMNNYGKTSFSKAPLSSNKPTRPDKAQMIALLQKHKGNVSAISKELGKARQQIHRWAERYDLVPESYRN